MRVLLVEDHLQLAESVAQALKSTGLTVDVLHDGVAADLALASEEYAVAVLDVGLPRMDGFEVLARLRARGKTVPVLMLTARSDVKDRVHGLNLGADDYLAKPFDVDELEARLRALLRRAAGRAQPLIRQGDIELDPAARTVRLRGQLVDVSPREFAVLLVLLESRGRVLSRRQLEERLYNWQSAVDSNAVEVHIHHLRRKLGSHCIQTMRGVGYFIPRDDA